MKRGRRTRQRYDVTYPVEMVTPQGIMRGRARNVSVTGAFICCAEPLIPGEVFKLTIKFPFGPPMKLSAQVVWSNASDPDDETTPRGMGVCFVW